MDAGAIRAFVQRYFEAWERQDVAALVACYTEDGLVESPLFGTVRGRAAIQASLQDLFRIFTDWSLHLDDIIVDTEPPVRAVLLHKSLATHRGELLGVPGTGRRFESRMVYTLRFRDGLIASETRLYDFTGVLVQLGILKARTA